MKKNKKDADVFFAEVDLRGTYIETIEVMDIHASQCHKGPFCEFV